MSFPATKLPSKPRWIKACLFASYGFLCTLGLLAWIGGELGVPELLSHWLGHFGLLLIPAAVGYLWLRPRWAALPALVLIGLIIGRMAPLYGPTPTPLPGESLRLITLNVLKHARTYETVRAYLLDTQADIVVLTEVTPAWAAALRPLRAAYPYRYAAPKWGYFGLMILSRYPLRDTTTHYLAAVQVPTLQAVVETPAGPLGLLAVHPPSPPNRQSMRWRNEILAELPRLRRTLPDQTVLAGDLNTTGFGQVFRRLCRETGLRDSRLGWGRQPSWRSHWGIAGIDLDHVLVSPGIGVSGRTVGPPVGSDHRPVVVDLVLP
ncbi:MAG: endonuclease/exonuclease/phosphatase family protein [Bacteroidetes bacterium]|nr:MAG: endonuclease/exonuclease/phosphatase family protein [Bacteroidota bacterium]